MEHADPVDGCASGTVERSAAPDDELPAPAAGGGSGEGAGEGAAGEDVLSRKKEPAGPQQLLVSTADSPLQHTVTALGLLSMPAVGVYPYTTQHTVQTLVGAQVVRGRGAVSIPCAMAERLAACGAADFEFFFLVNDASAALAKARDGTTLNVVHHAWCYGSDIKPRSKLGYGTPWQTGFFSVAGGGARPHTDLAGLKADTAFNCLRPADVHVHEQVGGLCCSPNNGRLRVDPTAGVVTFWTACVESKQADGRRPRACVSLHWVLTKASSSLAAAADRSETLAEFVESAGKALDGLPASRASAALSAARFALLGGPEPPDDGVTFRVTRPVWSSAKVAHATAPEWRCRCGMNNFTYRQICRHCNAAREKPAPTAAVRGDAPHIPPPPPPRGSAPPVLDRAAPLWVARNGAAPRAVPPSWSSCAGAAPPRAAVGLTQLRRRTQ
eukprot:TRINITY_DN4552_c0_g1_i2.p1 TRINITY_DN4552_c0_g1~~TRINITY_DN4552_c0_g1_i2.p1  ORF type:complete len:442 (+),score=100.65 TRINITY_DN4552_c0_g1_i2:61-1386(+)